MNPSAAPPSFNQGLVNSRRILILLLSPIWLTVALVSVLVGSAVFSGADPARLLAVAFYTGAAEWEALAVLAARALLLPFQLIFIMLVTGASLWVFRRRDRFGSWILGDPLAERLSSTELMAGELPAVLLPGRRRTLQQIFSSLVAITAIFVALLLIMGQFINRADLAIVVAALTSSLAWGARLPIGDLLGGISNIFESNLAVGDRIRYKQLDREVLGVVESVDLRYLSVRANNGELTSIPFGDLRVFRNLSRGDYIGVYAAFPIAAPDLGRAVELLTELAPRSMALVPYLIEPWQPMSPEGEMGAILDLHLFGKTTPELDDELQQAMHAVVHEQFAVAGIRLRGKENQSV